MRENEISSKIIGAAIEVHRQLGPVLLESSYEKCLAFELSQTGLDIKTQVSVPVFYKGIRLEVGYRLDIFG